MKVSVDKTQGLKREMTVTIPNQEIQPEIEQKVEKKIKQYAQEKGSQISIPGFRPGKVPLQILRRRVGGAIRQEVRQEVLDKVINKTCFEAIQQEKFKVAGMPDIEVTQDKEDLDLQYKVIFEVLPEVTLTDLDKIEVEKVTAEVTDDDLAKTLETLRHQHVTWKNAKRAAQQEDRVTLDFNGLIEGQSFEGSQASDFELILGSNSMIAGFEAGLAGMQVGEEKTLELQFPNDYYVKTFADKPVTFTVVVKAIDEPVLPELDEKLAKKFDVDTVEDLKKNIRGNMAHELTSTLHRQLKNQMIDALLQYNKIDVPEVLLQAEINRLRKRMDAQMKNQLDNVKDRPILPDALFKDQAHRHALAGLLMLHLVEKYELEPDMVRVDAMVVQLASVYEDSEAMAKKFREDTQYMEEIKQLVLEEQVVEKVLSFAKVEEKTKSFAEVMYPQGGQK